MNGRIAMAVGWPAFLAACALELLVFALVDPRELDWSGHPLGWSRQAVYTLSFFVFWVVSAAACALTGVLAGTAAAEDPRESSREPSRS